MDEFLRLIDGFLYGGRNIILRFLFLPDSELFGVQDFNDLAVWGAAYPDIVFIHQLLQMATYSLFVGHQVGDNSLELDWGATEDQTDAVRLPGDGVNSP